MAKKGIVYVSSDLKTKVLKRINDCCDIAEDAYGRKIDVPSVDFDCRGVTAGHAVLRENHISLNSVLLVENTDDFIARTVGHEVAHIIAFRLFGDRGHGRAWKRVMLVLGQDASRCHSYDVKNARVRKLNRRVYTCNCNTEHPITVQKHKKILSGMIKCRCRKCKTHIYDTGKQVTL